MKEKILNTLKNIHEAKTLIEINDLLGLTTVQEYQELEKKVESINKNKNGISWYLSFKEPEKECEEKISLNKTTEK